MRLNACEGCSFNLKHSYLTVCPCSLESNGRVWLKMKALPQICPFLVWLQSNLSGRLLLSAHLTLLFKHSPASMHELFTPSATITSWISSVDMTTRSDSIMLITPLPLETDHKPSTSACRTVHRVDDDGLQS